MEQEKEIEKAFDKIEQKVKELLQQRRKLINCLRTLKQELVKDEVPIHRVTKIIDMTLIKTDKEI